MNRCTAHERAPGSHVSTVPNPTRSPFFVVANGRSPAAQRNASFACMYVHETTIARLLVGGWRGTRGGHATPSTLSSLTCSKAGVRYGGEKDATNHQHLPAAKLDPARSTVTRL